MRRLITIIALGCLSLSAAAVKKATEDKELMEILSMLKQRDGYAYNVSVISRMKYDTTQKETQGMAIYASKAGFVRYIKTDDDYSFMNKNGLLKVFLTKKRVVYKQFTSDSMAQLAFEAVAVADPAKMADSILFDCATVGKKEIKDGFVHYYLSYRPDYFVKALELVFDKKKNEIVSMTYGLERPIAPVNNMEAVAYQKVIMNQYRHEVPQEVKKLITESGNFKKYVSDNYPEYIIRNL